MLTTRQTLMPLIILDGLLPSLGENEVLKEIPSDLETSTPSTQDKDK